MIYFDNAASTPVDKRVLDAMLPYFSDRFANPSNTSNMSGILVNKDVEMARNTVAKFMGCHSQQIFWTSGATESNNLSLQGAVLAYKRKFPLKKPHIITTSIEHKSVFETCVYLTKNEVDVSFVEPELNGEINIKNIEDKIGANTFLVSVMMANNEIGVVNDLKAICSLCNSKGILVHTDATQIIGKIDINILDLGVDFLTFSGHKIYASKGIGVLFVKNPDTISPIVFGGGQENGLRSGTLNVPGIIGVSEACKIFTEEGLEKESSRIISYRNILENLLLKFSDKIIINGYDCIRLPNISSISFPVKEGYDILNIIKDRKLIVCSSGSACDSADNSPSHVMKFIGKTRHESKNTIRFSLGRFTTIDEITEGAKHIIAILENIGIMD